MTTKVKKSTDMIADPATLIHVKLLPFNFFHSFFCAVEHGLQVTDLGLILYDNGATITRTNICRQHASKAVTCAMCMHGCITECYLIFTDYLTIQGHQLLEDSSQVCHIEERIWKNKGRSEEASDHIKGQEDLGTLDEIHLQHSKGGTFKYTTCAAS